MKYRLIFLAVASASLALSGAAAYAALPAASAAVSAPASHSAAAEFSWYKAAFPWDHSDLKPDPAMTYGVLPNGVRYVILPHQTPKGRVSLYLDVQAGSYFETPEQLGYAHYIEHMAFNGTKHFAPGSLIPFFQKNGGTQTRQRTPWKRSIHWISPPGHRISCRKGSRSFATTPTASSSFRTK